MNFVTFLLICTLDTHEKIDELHPALKPPLWTGFFINSQVQKVNFEVASAILRGQFLSKWFYIMKVDDLQIH